MCDAADDRALRDQLIDAHQSVLYATIPPVRRRVFHIDTGTTAPAGNRSGAAHRVFRLLPKARGLGWPAARAHRSRTSSRSDAQIAVRPKSLSVKNRTRRSRRRVLSLLTLADGTLQRRPAFVRDFVCSVGLDRFIDITSSDEVHHVSPVQALRHVFRWTLRQFANHLDLMLILQMHYLLPTFAATVPMSQRHEAAAGTINPKKEVLARSRRAGELCPECSLIRELVRPLAQSDGHDLPGSVDKGIPGVAAVIDDIVVGFEDAVREPVVAHVLPKYFQPD